MAWITHPYPVIRDELESPMVRVTRNKGGSSVVVTHALCDRIFAIVSVTVSAFIGFAFFRNAPGIDSESILAASLCLFFIALGVGILGQRVTIDDSFIEERGMSWKSRRITLPEKVIVQRGGCHVYLRDSTGGFKYRFPKHLDHGDKIERELRQLFSGSE